MDASMTSSHRLSFCVRADGGHTLASIQHSADGIVSIDSDYIVIVDQEIRDEWLPRDAIQKCCVSVAVGGNEAKLSQAANKRPRHS